MFFFFFTNLFLNGAQQYVDSVICKTELTTCTKLNLQKTEFIEFLIISWDFSCLDEKLNFNNKTL